MDEFIKETLLNSQYCDDFIEWIPCSNLENIKYLTNGGNSKVYIGTWNLLPKQSFLLLNEPKQLSVNIALKAIKDSHKNNDNILNEVKKNCIIKKNRFESIILKLPKFTKKEIIKILI